MPSSCLILDVGGSWVKGILLDQEAYQRAEHRADLLALFASPRRFPSVAPGDFTTRLLDFIHEITQGASVGSIVISTAGIVAPSGRHVTKCSDHLSFLREPKWAERLEQSLKCPAFLLNDAEAFTLGAAKLGYLSTLGTVCSLVVGTGLGFSIVKDGRWWQPNRQLPLLGSLRFPGGSFNSLVGAPRTCSTLEKKGSGPIAFAGLRPEYWDDFAQVLITTCLLHAPDRIIIGGGLCAAAASSGIDVKQEVTARLLTLPPELEAWPEITVASEGNALQLIGAAEIASGPLYDFHRPRFGSLSTEASQPDLSDLHERSTENILDLLYCGEHEASQALVASLPVVEAVVEHAATCWPKGGRLIYVGAGTSGRIAALDAVEIPCTFGQPRDRIVAILAGGLAEGSLSIEGDGQEDCTAVPDIALLNPTPHDTVIGLSASGSAFFVRSALAFAQARGSATVLIRAASEEADSPWRWTIPLHSGTEIVSGSTRMKAGTATKKVLNWITTALMIRCGQVRGPHMIDLACLNQKLVARGERILQQLLGLSPEQASDLLRKNHYNLRQSVESEEKNHRPTSGVTK